MDVTNQEMMNARPCATLGKLAYNLEFPIDQNIILTLIFCLRAATRSDMMTPLNRSVARVAKPGERLFLVSDNSSPIVDGTYTATKGRAKKAIKPAKVLNHYWPDRLQ